MVRLLLISFAIVLAFAQPTTAQLYSTLSPRFSGSVDEGSYSPIEPVAEPGGAISRKRLTDGLLYFSFSVQINEETLRYLRARRRLEVKCIVYADGYSEDAIEIGITPANWTKIKSVVLEAIRRDGVFNWRTYMNTEKVDANSISIIVKDGRNHVVKPSGFPGSYEATVQLVESKLDARRVGQYLEGR